MSVACCGRYRSEIERTCRTANNVLAGYFAEKTATSKTIAGAAVASLKQDYSQPYSLGGVWAVP